GGSRHPQQAEGQAREIRLLAPAVVAGADGGEELIGREREAPDHVDLIDEDDEAGVRSWELAVGGRRRRSFPTSQFPTPNPQLRQHHLAERRRPAPQRPQPLTALPERLTLVSQSHRLPYPPAT